MEKAQADGQKQNDFCVALKLRMSNKFISMSGIPEKEFIQLIQRGINTWDTAPAKIKELADYIIHGKELQNYEAQEFGSTHYLHVIEHNKQQEK